MKKLMIAVALVCAAVYANASSFDWKSAGSKGGNLIYDAAGNLIADNVNAYLFAFANGTGTTAAENLLKDLRAGGTFDSSAAVSTAQTADGAIGTTPFSYGTTGSDYDFYFAIIDGDNIMISEVKAGQPAQEAGTTHVNFSGTANYENLGKADYAGGGWYSVASVPEPTSGLLLLLGVAGLALKRRRA